MLNTPLKKSLKKEPKSTQNGRFNQGNERISVQFKNEYR